MQFYNFFLIFQRKLYSRRVSYNKQNGYKILKMINNLTIGRLEMIFINSGVDVTL